MERLKGDTLQQFLAAVAIDRFDSQMAHEWSTYSSDPSKLPTL